MRIAVALSLALLALLAAPSLASERDRCPDTQQQLAADAAVDSKIGGRVDGRAVALGRMNDASTRVVNGVAAAGGGSFAPPVTQADIDAKRLALANLEIWAMSIGDQALRNAYLCSIMKQRRGVDDAELEMTDRHAQKDIESEIKKSKSGLQIPSLVGVPGASR